MKETLTVDLQMLKRREMKLPGTENHQSTAAGGKRGRKDQGRTKQQKTRSYVGKFPPVNNYSECK